MLDVVFKSVQVSFKLIIDLNLFSDNLENFPISLNRKA